MTVPVLIIPGIGNSGPAHWQSRWQAQEPTLQRVEQKNWDAPRYEDWRDALEAAVAAAPQPPVLVAHSLGCLLVARWALETAQPVRAALLVAPPDPAGPAFPVEAQGFTLPREEFPFPSLVVASRDDPYGPLIFAARCAALWGSRFADAGYCGHINADSGLGDWPWGRQLLHELGA
jgi:predicted alpha/beta hydrolase family esterase